MATEIVPSAFAGYRTAAGVISAADGILADVAEGYVEIAEARRYRGDMTRMLRTLASEGAADAFAPALSAAGAAWRTASAGTGTTTDARRAFVEHPSAADWLRIVRLFLGTDADWTGR